MAAPEFTPEGISIQTFDEIFEELADGYRSIYGADIDLDQNSPDGQRVGIEAKARHDMQQLAIATYNAMDADLASDVALKSIIKWAGINIRPATQSQWDLQITTDRALTLADDYTVQDELGQRWVIASETAVASGVSNVSFRSVEFGAVVGLTGYAISQVTVELGITAIAATSDALVGVDEETDAEARQRRKLSVRNPSYSLIGGLYAKLADLSGVTALEIYENDTDVYDATRDINPHTYWVVIEGGDISAIAEVMAKQKTGGTGEKGAATGSWVETLTRPNGSTISKTHTADFDRPTDAPIYITANASRRDASVSIDTSAIEASIASRDFNIGENAIASSLYAEGYAAGDNYFLTDLLISDDNITFTDERLISDYDGKFSIDVANVAVTEV